MGLARLGKRKHTVYRDVRVGSGGTNASGFYEDGEWIQPELEEIEVVMNIQANFSSYMTKKLPQGDREKEAIWFSSDSYIYTAGTGASPHKPDVILYRGCYWEVRTVGYYGNFGTHCEGIAVKLNKEPQGIRLTGDVGVIRESDYTGT